MQSFEEGVPQDQNKNPVPWMNYSAVKLLEERLNNNLSLFEFGSGYSTCFYASKVRNVISVEYDRNWYQFMESTLPANASLIFKDKDVDGGYCRTISSMTTNYDVVIVDGRDRVNCIKQSISALSSEGVILLDDSKRERYQEGVCFLIDRGFKALNLEGLKATGLGVDRTTVFYREGNCFGI